MFKQLVIFLLNTCHHLCPSAACSLNWKFTMADVAPLKLTGSACDPICFRSCTSAFCLDCMWCLDKFVRVCVCVLRMLWVTVQSQTQSQNCLPHICSWLQPNKRLKNAAAKSACFTTSGATSFFPYAASAASAAMRQPNSVGPSQFGLLHRLCCKRHI